ncbi:MAG: lipopolysaccharide biosynthesis protein [Burkholderiales bacterium]|nr:lipopolysaccharide biosynthesis protein [Burkholderiales bacterium]
MNEVRKSFLLSFADSYLAIVLQLASTVIIARLLTPAEVGVFAIAAVFSSLASTFRDFGVAEYLIQSREIDDDKIRAGFGVNIIVSWSLAVLLVAAAPLAASFYRDEGVGRVLRVLALSFIALPFGAMLMTWFRRELNYRPIVIVNAISSSTVFAVSVGLAWLGHGYMSLAWGTLAGILATVASVNLFRPPGFPRWPRFTGLGEVFHFGKYATGMYILVQLGRGAPELIIGRVRNAADVGIFSRANGLVEIFRRLLLRPVMQVCLPFFARAQREQGTIEPSYASSVALLTAVGWPFLAFLALASYAMVRLVYGTQWLAAVPLARVLCLACAIELLFFLSREALLACGAVRRASVLQFQVVALQIMGLALALPYGLMGACWGLALAACGGLLVTQWHLKRAFGMHLRALLRACLPSATLTIWTVAPLAAVALWQPPGEANYIAWALLGSFATAVLWLAGLRVLRHPLWAEVVHVTSRISQRAWGRR